MLLAQGLSKWYQQRRIVDINLLSYKKNKLRFTMQKRPNCSAINAWSGEADPCLSQRNLTKMKTNCMNTNWNRFFTNWNRFNFTPKNVWISDILLFPSPLLDSSLNKTEYMDLTLVAYSDLCLFLFFFELRRIITNASFMCTHFFFQLQTYEPELTLGTLMENKTTKNLLFWKSLLIWANQRVKI